MQPGAMLGRGAGGRVGRRPAGHIREHRRARAGYERRGDRVTAGEADRAEGGRSGAGMQDQAVVDRATWSPLPARVRACASAAGSSARPAAARTTPPDLARARARANHTGERRTGHAWSADGTPASTTSVSPNLVRSASSHLTTRDDRRTKPGITE